MNRKRMMRRAYFEGVADGLSRYPAKEREGRFESHYSTIVQEEVEELKEFARGQAVATLVMHGVHIDSAKRMVESGDCRVADDGISVEMSVRMDPPRERVLVTIVAPKEEPDGPDQ